MITAEEITEKLREPMSKTEMLNLIRECRDTIYHLTEQSSEHKDNFGDKGGK